MGKFDPVRTCCVCGSRLPEYLSREELIQKGCTLQMPDGALYFRCMHHSDLEVKTVLGYVPAFCTGNEYRKYASDK